MRAPPWFMTGFSDLLPRATFTTPPTSAAFWSSMTCACRPAMDPVTSRSIVNGRLRAAFAGTVAVTATGCPGAGARSAATAAWEPSAAAPSTSDILIRNLEVRGTAVLLLASGETTADPDVRPGDLRPDVTPGTGPRG